MWVPYKINSGLNQEDPDILLAEGQVRASQNMIFERGVASVRPGTSARFINFMTTTAGTTPVVPQPFISGVIQAAGVAFLPYTIIVGLPYLYTYRYDTTGPAFPSTYAGRLGGGYTPHVAAATYANSSMAAVNSSVLVCMGNGMKISYLYTGTAENVVDGGGTPVKWKYVVAHKSRAVVASSFAGVGLAEDRYVGWSVTGDESNYYSPGSGQTLLADANTSIVGLGNIRDTIVVCREDGFHLGTLTGSGDAPYNWQRHSGGSIGVRWEYTLAFHGDRCFFVGTDDVYTFDLVSVVPIGRAIRRELIKLLKNGAYYRGHVSIGSADNPRLTYNLVPLFGATPFFGGDYPHFCYDLQTGAWSRHEYDAPMNGGAFFAHTTAQYGNQIMFLDGTQAPSNSMANWDDTVTVTRECFMQGRSESLASPDREISVNRVMLVYQNFGSDDVTAILTAEGVSAETPTSASLTKALPPTTRWSRIFFDMRVQGSFNSCELRLPFGGRVQVASIWLDVADGGMTRNA